MILKIETRLIVIFPSMKSEKKENHAQSEQNTESAKVLNASFLIQDLIP
jgi:hypothetical protein